MRKISMKLCFFALALVSLVACNQTEQSQSPLTKVDGPKLTYILPSHKTDGNMSVERAMTNRRSQRNFVDKAISAENLSQILWAAYGITQPMPDRPALRGGLRAAPSAGALYPFEIYAVIGKVDGIEAGVYKYISEENKIVRIIDKDIREEFAAAALGQDHVKTAPVTIFYSAIYSRMTKKYGDRGGERYVCMDLGHSAQNIYLQAEALNLGTCAIGAFSDDKISEMLNLPEEEVPLYMMPVGFYYK